jgi:hypothetical protein
MPFFGPYRVHLWEIFDGLDGLVTCMDLDGRRRGVAGEEREEKALLVLGLRNGFGSSLPLPTPPH